MTLKSIGKKPLWSQVTKATKAITKATKVITKAIKAMNRTSLRKTAVAQTRNFKFNRC